MTSKRGIGMASIEEGRREQSHLSFPPPRAKNTLAGDPDCEGGAFRGTNFRRFPATAVPKASPSRHWRHVVFVDKRPPSIYCRRYSCCTSDASLSCSYRRSERHKTRICEYATVHF